VKTKSVAIVDLFFTRDRTAIVPAGSPLAFFRFARVGDEVGGKFVDRYDLGELVDVLGAGDNAGAGELALNEEE
jgi:hypothetical protein